MHPCIPTVMRPRSHAASHAPRQSDREQATQAPWPGPGAGIAERCYARPFGPSSNHRLPACRFSMFEAPDSAGPGRLLHARSVWECGVGAASVSRRTGRVARPWARARKPSFQPRAPSLRFVGAEGRRRVKRRVRRAGGCGRSADGRGADRLEHHRRRGPRPALGGPGRAVEISPRLATLCKSL